MSVSAQHVRPEDVRVPGSSPVAYVPQAGREGLAAVLVACGAALVLGLWWKDTPPDALAGLPDQLAATGRVTGLLGAYLVLVEVVLLSRVPWIDRLIGRDRLATWHRRNGQYSISLLVAHAVFTLWGYAGIDQTGVVDETRDVLGYPYVLMGTIGLGLLVVVGIVSARAVRRRVGYQTWYTLHLLTYGAIALSFMHQLANGEDFVEHPVNRLVWTGTYLAVAAGLLVWRVGVPLHRAGRHRLTVSRVVPEGPGVFSIYVSGRRLDDLKAEAGQFFSWRFLTRRLWSESHPFSLSAAPDPHWLRVTVKAVGDHTRELVGLRPGVRVLAEGPYGAFTEARRTRRKVLFVGGGIGVAPLRALFEAMPAAPGDLTLLYRVSRPTDAVLRTEFDAIAARRGAAVHYLEGSRHQSPDPLSPDELARRVPGLVHHDVFVCGPPGMVAKVRESLRTAGVPSRRIHTEAFEL